MASLTSLNSIGSLRQQLREIKLGGSIVALNGSRFRSINTDLSFISTNDFTIEFWHNPNGDITGTSRILSFTGDGSKGWSLHQRSYIEDGGIRVAYSFQNETPDSFVLRIIKPGSNFQVVNGEVTYVENKWTHVAVCRAGTTIRTFLDGVLCNNVNVTPVINYSPTNGILEILQEAGNGIKLTGLVISKDALYTNNSGFIPRKQYVNNPDKIYVGFTCPDLNTYLTPNLGTPFTFTTSNLTFSDDKP